MTSEPNLFPTAPRSAPIDSASDRAELSESPQLTELFETTALTDGQDDFGLSEAPTPLSASESSESSAAAPPAQDSQLTADQARIQALESLVAALTALADSTMGDGRDALSSRSASGQPLSGQPLSGQSLSTVPKDVGRIRLDGDSQDDVPIAGEERNDVPVSSAHDDLSQAIAPSDAADAADAADPLTDSQLSLVNPMDGVEPDEPSDDANFSEAIANLTDDDRVNDETRSQNERPGLAMSAAEDVEPPTSALNTDTAATSDRPNAELSLVPVSVSQSTHLQSLVEQLLAMLPDDFQISSTTDKPNRLLDRPEAVVLLLFVAVVLVWQAYLSLIDEVAPSGSLTTRQLARRLEVKASAINRRKELQNFSEWTQFLDPDNIAWIYEAGVFVPRVEWLEGDRPANSAPVS